MAILTNFIGVYENILSEEFCQKAIEKFKQSKHAAPGATGQGVDLIKKNSSDITISSFPEWRQEIEVLQSAVLTGLVQYVRAHPFLLAGAISVQVQTENGVESVSYVDIPNLSDQALVNMIKAVYRLGSINIQKYEKNEGGYFYWHSEVYPHPKDQYDDSLHRTLLWMFYLNDVEEGGETDFYFQNASVKPKRGSLVIAPAGFTHTHRGNKPVSDDKYIFTSWVMYQRSSQLYGTAES